MVRKVLFVTATPARQRLWEERLADAGSVVQHCSGPNAACPLLTQGHCPLIDECQTAVYDADVVTPDFLVALLSAPPRAEVHFVSSDHAGPRTTHVLTSGVVHPVAGAA
jgi:hypothetical protein